MQQPRSHEIRLSVPFHDLDPMDVVWHGNYLKYFDMARFALFREAGSIFTGIPGKTAAFFLSSVLSPSISFP